MKIRIVNHFFAFSLQVFDLSAIEYVSVAWSPHQLYPSLWFQRLQQRFTKLMALKMRVSKTNEDHMAMFEGSVELQPLQQRGDLSDLEFIFKVIRSLIECRELLVSVDLSSIAPNKLFNTCSTTQDTIVKQQRHQCCGLLFWHFSTVSMKRPPSTYTRINASVTNFIPFIPTL